MKKKILLLIIPVFLVFQGCNNDEEKTINTEKRIEQVTNVEIQKVEKANFMDFVKSIGTVKAFKSSNLSFKSGGTIAKIFVDKGSDVQKGDTLIAIDTKMSKASMNAAKAQYELAKITFEKQSKVYKANVGSEFQYLQSKFQKESSKANYEIAKSQYEDGFLIAPFSGRVDSRNYEIGELATPGMPVISLVQLNPLKVEIGVSENYAHKIKTGMKVNFSSTELGEEKITGKISFVGASVIKANRSFPVEVKIENPKNMLKPGMLLDAKIELGNLTNVFIIPEEVIKRGVDGYTCFVEKDGISVPKAVDLYNRVNGNAIINSGLEVGDNLIVVGYQKLVKGEKVRIVN